MCDFTGEYKIPIGSYKQGVIDKAKAKSFEHLRQSSDSKTGNELVSKLKQVITDLKAIKDKSTKQALLKQLGA